MYCLRVIIKHVFTSIGCCISELHAHICPRNNVWPEAVYCCFTGTILFTKLFTCWFQQRYGFLSFHKVSLLYTF